ncbi:cupin domain-containing protein [Nocardiopsis sp. JB363]|uniref:cupin domain-containing protein n=1 Tax=Nocardiopsis sp. JB363 TaxID=1434837 RepID=UPI000979FEB4|nr:cupin domain-containing protein [Nocardiopsis sp. JB363]SIO84347.1 hypothetical protein BQ8420_01430 [Nocardiopsis sp. JB363]
MTPFPGGTAVSHLWVYDWLAEDGVSGGSPHLHTASAEGYVVIRGRGTLETLSGAGHQKTTLRQGTLLWFTPGTVHRLINNSGDLELLVVMQNAGLPESGDAVLTYPREFLADSDAYREATAVASPEEARQRRDLAVQGYLELREQVRREGPSALTDLHRSAVDLVRDKAVGWHHHVQRGVVQQAESAQGHLDALSRGDGDHLSEAAVFTAAEGSRTGMCGDLRVWDLDGATAL